MEDMKNTSVDSSSKIDWYKDLRCELDCDKVCINCSVKLECVHSAEISPEIYDEMIADYSAYMDEFEKASYN